MWGPSNVKLGYVAATIIAAILTNAPSNALDNGSVNPPGDDSDVQLARIKNDMLVLKSAPKTYLGSTSPEHQRVFEIQADAGYLSSLFYVVENISGTSVMQAPSPYYREFWIKHFGLDESDESLLQSYADLRDKYGADWPLFFVGSRTFDECWQKAGRELDGADLDTLEKIFNRFDTKFRPYWQDHSGSLRTAQDDLEHGGYSKTIEGYLDEVSGFLELAPDIKRRYTVALVWHPGLKASAGFTHGLRLKHLLLVEIPENGNLDKQIGVVVHECIHDLYAAIPQEVRDTLKSDLFKTDKRSAEFFMQGMNEGLATALGQGLFMQRYVSAKFDMNRAWYASDVDKFAKAVFPVVRGALQNGTTLRACDQQLLVAIRPLLD